MIAYSNRGWSLAFRLRGTVFATIAPPALVCGFIGAVLVGLQRQQFDLSIRPTAHLVVGFALALFLVARTRASYERFAEGRRLTSDLVARVLTLTRQSSYYIDGEEREAQELRTDVGRLGNALYIAVRQHLRGEIVLGEYGDTLSHVQKTALSDASHGPQLISSWISAKLRKAGLQGRLSEQRLQLLDENLVACCELWTRAEGLDETPLPFAYAHHARAFLWLFCLTLPFALLHDMGVATPIAAALVAYGLLGIEAVGSVIENPFGSDVHGLPLDTQGATLTEDVNETLAVHAAAQAQVREARAAVTASKRAAGVK
jgi:putative membrane protein